MPSVFDHKTAFSRTVGWVTETELEQLRGKRVAIAGLGGVGGSHLLTLARLGIGAFSLADMDVFAPENLNRQAGAFQSTLGKPKLDVLADMALDVNPELALSRFPSGISTDNIGEFLEDADIYVDSLDFFELDIRRRVFAECARRGIPAITAAPLGMGTAILAFLPGGMSFENYFRLDGQPATEQYLRFMLGLSPALLQVGYLVSPEAVNLAARRGPSTPMACELCAGAAGSQTLKILLGRGRVPAAPWGLHFDAYRNRFKRTWRPGGNQHPIQQLALMIARKRFRNELGAPVTVDPLSSAPS